MAGKAKRTAIGTRQKRDYRRELKDQKRQVAALTAPRKGERFDAFKAWAEKLIIPDGRLRGQRFKIHKFQEDFLRPALDGDATESWYVSGRKNFKTSGNLLLAGAHLFGPLNEANLQAAYLSYDGELSRIAHRWLKTLIEINDIEGVRTPGSNPPTIHGWNNSIMVFRASGKITGQGLNLTAAFLDEVGFWEENRRPQLNSMRTAISGADGKVYCFTVRGDSDFVREAQERADLPSMNFVMYSADPDLPIDDEANWHKANPALAVGGKSLAFMREWCERAKRTPADLAEFKAYDLNLPVSLDKLELVPIGHIRELYDENAVLQDEGVYLGVDLGGQSSMSAAVACGMTSGTLRVWGVFPLGEMSLAERGLRDGLGKKYEQMFVRGELATHPGRVVDYNAFVKDVVADLNGHGCWIEKVGSDRYAVDFLRQALIDVGLDDEAIWQPRGTGAGKVADGSADVRSFQRCVAQGRVRLTPSLLFEEGIKAARLRMDSGGNFAIDKGSWNHRCDIAVAASIAVGFYDRQEPEEGWEFVRQNT